MKKAIMAFCMLMTLFATNMFAQEVRGIETRRATYEGESYELEYINYGRTRDSSHTLGTSSEYYGFEFSNLNSITVSVTIEVYEKGNPDKMVDTKEVVLKSKEKYIHKYPTLKKYIDYYNSSRVYSSYDNHKSDGQLWKECNENGLSNASCYYVKYKAFKLQ